MHALEMRTKLLSAVVMTAIITAGCEDSTTEPAEPLTMQETEALYLGLQRVAMDTTNIVSVTPVGAVIACPGGGQAALVVDVREETAADTARLVTGTTIDPEGCVIPSEGHEFTLDGNPNVQMDLNVTIVGSTFEFLFDGSLTGGVDWQLDDRSGTCMIDLTLDVEVADPPTATFSGTMCDHAVEFEATGVVQTPGAG